MAISTQHQIQHIDAAPTIEGSGGGAALWVRPLRALMHEVRHLRRLEQAGESEWTPWIALAGLFLFLATVYFLFFGTVELVSHLFMSAL